MGFIGRKCSYLLRVVIKIIKIIIIIIIIIISIIIMCESTEYIGIRKTHDNDQDRKSQRVRILRPLLLKFAVLEG